MPNLDLNQTKLLISIFSHNQKLLEMYSDFLLNKFSNLVIKYGRESRWIDLLKIITSAKGVTGIELRYKLVQMFAESSEYNQNMNNNLAADASISEIRNDDKKGPN